MNICFKGVIVWIPKFLHVFVIIWLTSWKLNLKKITPDSDIVNDFGADSLDVIDMITTLSDEFGVEIPDEDIETFHTVGDVVNYLEGQNRERAPAKKAASLVAAPRSCTPPLDFTPSQKSHIFAPDGTKMHFFCSRCIGIVGACPPMPMVLKLCEDIE